MNWDAMGAVGQILGSVAVFITLWYLAVQTRQVRQEVRHAMDRGITEDANNWLYRVIEHPEIAELYRTGMRKPDDLTPTDRFRFCMPLEVMFRHWEHAFLADTPVSSTTISA